MKVIQDYSHQARARTTHWKPYILRGAYFCAALLSLPPTTLATPLDISPNPLFVTAGVPPNIFVTLDTSSSMHAAHTPDGTDSLHNTKRYKSAYFNPMYYNPAVQYTAPLKYDGSAASTSFDLAWINGFDPTRGSLNLRTSYRVTRSYDPDSSSQTLATETNPFSSSSTVETPFSFVCTVTFNQRSGDDRIEVSSCSGGTSNIFTTANLNASGTTAITVSGSDCSGTNPSNRNATYNATRDSDTRVNVGNPWTNDCNNKPNVTLSWTKTTTGATVNPAYYYLFYAQAGAAQPGTCDGTRTDDDCYIAIKVGTAQDIYQYSETVDGVTTTRAATEAEKEQNFANWYSFYRTRTLSLISSADIAFWDVSDQARIAWQNLNTCSTFTGSDCPGRSGTNYDNRIRKFSGTHRDNFFKWLFDINSVSGTPLRIAAQRVGEYIKSPPSATNDPFAENPQSSAGTLHSCRKNFHILMTDGEWNTSGESGLTAVGNLDGTLPNPYNDNRSDSLADVIYKYWATDLRTLTNNVRANIVDISGDDTARYNNPRNNPATWQHLVTFTMGLGLTEQLTDPAWAGDTYAGGYSRLLTGTDKWTDLPSDTTRRVYDLWHGAINSRGQFFSVEDPAAMTAAFKTILAQIDAKNPAAAALTANSTRIETGSMVYQAKFNTTDWSGELSALPVDSNGQVGAVVWQASQRFPNHDARNIYSWNDTSNSGIVFKDSCSVLSSSQQLALDTNALGVDDDRCLDRMNWLRGQVISGFRARPHTVLGDIVNSDPAYVQKIEDKGYSSLSGTEGSSYLTFITSQSNRIPMVYVGANDGMMHAIRANLPSETITSTIGAEMFAYIPAGVYQNLSRLTNSAYTHQFFVDGSPTVGDAYLSGWKTVLVGGLNAGGRTIYALDVTNPAAFNASKVLWEFSHTDLGYTYSQPQIGRLRNGVWAAVFGSGYNSPTERAYLFIVNLATGALVRDPIPAGTSCTSNCSNGLSTPVLHDSNGDKVVDTVYAGDLQGHLWKFDLSDSDPQQWGVAFSGEPLFTAVNDASEKQAITTQPSVRGHPDGGVMVYFGTGQYLTSTDVSTTSTQSFYGLRDNGIAISGRDELQVQTFSNTGIIAGLGVRTTSDNEVEWLDGNGNPYMKGWYIDFGTRERVISPPYNVYDRIGFNTMIPSSDPCVSGGDGWIMQLDAVTGKRAAKSFGFNGDGVFDDEDKLGDETVSAVKSPVDITDTPVLQETGTETSYLVFTGTSGGTGTLETYCPTCTTPPGTVQRVYWMQIQ